METQRLILRPIGENDFGALHAYMSDAETKRFMVYEPNTPEDTRAFIDNAVNDCAIYEFAVIPKESGRLVGNIGLYKREEEAEIGWLINRENQGKGYATEAAKEVVRFAFEELKLKRVFAHCDAENAASYNVMRKLNMRLASHAINERRSNSVLGHMLRDEYCCAVTDGEYFDKCC